MKEIQDLGLQKFGIINWEELYYNLSYDELYKHEVDSSLQGFERVAVSKLGAVAVDTGKYTGRSPKDKYIVDDGSASANVWWADGKSTGSDNKKIAVDVWQHLKELSVGQLNGKKLYVSDGFCGTNIDTRMCVRLVTEVAWMAHFFKNMFIRPTAAELEDFTPDWTILNACKVVCKDFAKYGLNSEAFIAFNIQERTTVIGGTWYGGEIKKGIFSIMNYFLPLKGIGSFHCSANMGKAGDTALFFGLSGTGKTTLSTDPQRQLIGDDEHGWDSDGIFNFEGGCYAKCIDLSLENEPEIYRAIRRDALLENVTMDDDGNIDFNSKVKTENSRVSYPIYHIDNIVKPVSKGRHSKKIIFLTCDAYGVLPPVSKLTKDQAMYHYLSGYTAKVAGTECGVKQLIATFSACFGKAFLMVHPTIYSDILGKKMTEHGAEAYLVNTGWIGGKYGVGFRMPLKESRVIIDRILDGSIDQAAFDTLPVFNLQIPRVLNGVDTKILNPRDSWVDKADYDVNLRKLAQMFGDNFSNFKDTSVGQILANQAGPKL